MVVSTGTANMKRPPPPSLQTAATAMVNGVHSVQSSPSPLLSSKRPPLEHRQTANSVANASNVAVNGFTPRSGARQRKDTSRATDTSGRTVRINSLAAKGGATDASEQERRRMPKKLPPQPYGTAPLHHLHITDELLTQLVSPVRTTAYMLRKFRGVTPSLVVHLHPSYFRFDQQDGSFGYNSPMKMFLDHVRASTIPHDMLEELIGLNVRFYDGWFPPWPCSVTSRAQPRTSRFGERKLTWTVP